MNIILTNYQNYPWKKFKILRLPNYGSSGWPSKIFSNIYYEVFSSLSLFF